MSFQTTFIQAARPIVKTITADGTKSPPPPKMISSFEYTLPDTDEGLREKFKLMQEYASKGGALYKGHFTRQLVTESRAGLTKKTKTRNVIFDLDGVNFIDFRPTFPMSAEHAQEMSEFVIGKLPKVFHGVSYIAHLSNSMGFKDGSINLHLDFLLDFPVDAALLRTYLEHLNFSTEDFSRQITLTPSNRTLHYPIDPCLAENSRMVFIGDPTLVDVDNPIEGDRIFLVEKAASSVDLTHELMSISPKQVAGRRRKHLNLLQQSVGFEPPKSQLRKIKLHGQSHSTQVETQPGEISFEEHADMGEYVTYNVNNGDSHAYYVKKNQPEIVFNFKGESPFWFENANEEAFQQHIQKYPPGEHGGNPYKPMVFRDIISDTYYNALYDPAEGNLSEIYPAQKGSLEDFMLSYNDVIPSPIPSWRYVFDPTTDTVLSVQDRFINRFHKPALLEKSPMLKDEHQSALYSQHAELLETATPTIYKVLHSAVGDDGDCLNHLINWLGAIIQERAMTRTAFLLQGSFGTGKGLIFRIMSTILGKYATEKRTENVDEDFNAWLETSLLVCVDEFRAGDSKTEQKLLNKIKNYITEPIGTIRAMRENQKLVQLYCNWLFFSNEHDPIRIEENDRRMNICPRQETPLNHRYSGWDALVESTLDAEIPVFASYLKSLVIERAQVSAILPNQARRDLIATSKTTVDEFRDAVLAGNFWYFHTVMDSTQQGDRTDANLGLCQTILRGWLTEINGQPMDVWADSLRPFYNYLLGNNIATQKFPSLLRKRGIPVERRTLGNSPKDVIRIKFNLDEVTLKRLRATYLGTTDDNTLVDQTG